MDDGLRQFVRARASHRCEYCRIPQAAITFVRFHVEHIRARQHGGNDDPDNLALACRRCNAFKGPNLTAIDTFSGDVVSLFNPRRDAWDDHFVVEEFLIIGLTKVGRATAALLNMNAPDRVQLRIELAQIGEQF
jgi:hypothetical protein